MIRFTIAICTWWISVGGITAAQPPAGATVGGETKPPLVKSVAAPARSSPEILPAATSTEPPKSTVEILPAAPPASPGEAPMTHESRAHEQYLLQLQAQAQQLDAGQVDAVAPRLGNRLERKVLKEPAVLRAAPLHTPRDGCAGEPGQREGALATANGLAIQYY